MKDIWGMDTGDLRDTDQLLSSWDREDYKVDTLATPGYSHKKPGYSKCADNHPPLKIKVGDQTYKIQGGSCTTPGGGNCTTGADIVVGLDSGMEKTKRQYPWTKGYEFLYRIQDMGVPTNLQGFEDLLAWLEERVLAGQKVFIGCIGGHGRTGTVLAALYTRMTGKKDSIKVVREQVCSKCVESQAQVDWLHKHYGIVKQKPTKSWGGAKSTYKMSDFKSNGKGYRRKDTGEVDIIHMKSGTGAFTRGYK